MKAFRQKKLAILLCLSIVAGSSSFSVFAVNDQQRLETDSIDYILGRPMTEAEKIEQEAMVPELKELPLPDELVEPVHTEGRAGASDASQVRRFDLREEGLVTSVKSQVIDGPCWAFSAIAMAESAMAGQGMGLEPDFSEEHLAYFFYNRQNDPLGNTSGDKNMASWTGNNYKSVGGNLQLASKFLSTWSGAASEAMFPYSVSSSGLDAGSAYESEVHLQNARFITSSVDELKQAVYSHRQPVGITYYHDSSYWNKETGAYCYPRSTNTINHAVTIVGWDDDYSKDNFHASSGAVNDGAWIVKNSWGEQSGDHGYIYISYEDKTLQGAVSADFEPADTYDHNYQYDGSSGSGSIAVPPGASHANVFQVKGNPFGSEILKAAGILVNSSNASLSIDVYTDLLDTADPSSGVHVIHAQRAETSYSGYYTFLLEQDVMLQEGSYFSVVFTNCSDEKKSFAIESALDSGWIRFETGVESGQSFYRDKEGKDWRDMNGDYLSSGKPVNARIKAYTVDSQKTSVDVTETPSVTLVPEPTAVETPGVVPTTAPEETEKPEITLTVTPVETKEPEITLTVTPDVDLPAPEETETPSTVPTAVPADTPEAVPSEIPVPGQASVTSTISKKNKITLKWKPVSHADRYEIYRTAVSGGSWKLVGTTGKTSYVDRKLLPAFGYGYRIRAVCKTGTVLKGGAYSKRVNVLTRPAVPGNRSIKAIAGAGKKVKAEFTCKTSARASGYEIYQYNHRTKQYQPSYRIQGTKVYIYQKAEKKYKKIGKVRKSGGKTACTLTKINLKQNKKQYFKVRAYVEKSGYSRQYSKFSGKIILK